MFHNNAPVVNRRQAQYTLKFVILNCIFDFDRKMFEIPELNVYESETNTDDKLYEFSVKRPLLFWDKIARARLQWFKEFDQVCNTDNWKSFLDTDFRVKWFSGGKLNTTGLLWKKFI